MNLAASEHCVHCKGDTSLMYFNLTLHGRNLPRRSVLAAFLDTMIIKFEILFFFFLKLVHKSNSALQDLLVEKKKKFSSEEAESLQTMVSYVVKGSQH